MFRLTRVLHRRLAFVLVVLLILQLPGLTAATTVHAATNIKVFVGLLGGADWQKETYDAVAKAWNNSHGDIHLEFVYHFYANNGAAQAQSALRRELAGKEPPDIIGPIGLSGANLLPPETWADLAPMISADPLPKDNFSENATNYYKAADGKILALATGIYPGMLFVNESLFDKAGVPLPPKTYGVPYKDKDGNSKVWDWDTLAEVAQQVTTDKTGKHPGEDKFNKNAIDVYGFASFWLNFRDAAASFGMENAGIADDGKTATFDQPAIQKAVQWYQDGVFKSYFIPNSSKRNMFERNSSPFESGKLAMWYAHSWYFCCAGNFNNNPKFVWSAYPLPAVPGTDGKKIVSPLHADGFGIVEKSANKEAAWQVLKWLVTDKDATILMSNLWNAVPTALNARSKWGSSRTSQWSIFSAKRISVVFETIDNGEYPLNESYVPNYKRVSSTIDTFWSRVTRSPISDVEKALTTLNKQVQSLYDSALKAKK